MSATHQVTITADLLVCQWSGRKEFDMRATCRAIEGQLNSLLIRPLEGAASMIDNARVNIDAVPAEGGDAA